MLGEDESDRTSEERAPDTPLHAYKEGREDDVEGDVEKLKSGDPEESQRAEVADGDESGFPEAPKH